jgi:hypothetical protein
MWLFIFKLIPAWFIDYVPTYWLWIAVARRAYDECQWEIGRKLPVDKSGDLGL